MPRRLEILPKDRRWRCQYCSSEMWQEPLIYTVPLCSLCIHETAERKDRFWHMECRLYLLEIELAKSIKEIEHLKDILQGIELINGTVER